MTQEWTVRGIVAATFPLLLVLTVLELWGGLVLNAGQAVLTRYPSLLTLVPGIIAVAGNLGSVLASRLSTAFHLGTLSFDPADDALAGNALATFALAATLFPAVGAGAWAARYALGDVELALATVVFIAAASGVLLAVVAVAIAVAATYAAYQFRLDPDDVVIPVVTTTCDVLGVVVFLLVVGATV
ncbi:MAG: magnesium transporter [Halobacterium sp.]